MEPHEQILQALRTDWQVLRLDLYGRPHTVASDRFDVELLHYWSDDEGNVLLHVSYAAQRGQVPKLQAKIITWAFMEKQRDSEIEAGIRAIAPAWKAKRWDTAAGKQVRRLDGPQGSQGKANLFSYMTPANVFATQLLSRLRGAIELASLNPQAITEMPENLSESEESFLVSELRSTLKALATSLSYTIGNGNHELSRLTGLI